jgi:hypothetical protein
MTIIKLQQTEFHIEKLKNVVNVGHSSAYQILTSPGTVLGRMGPIADTEIRTSANDESFSDVTTNAGETGNRHSWVKKALSALRTH